MALNQAQTSGLDELNKKISSGYTPTATDTANLDYAKKQGYVYKPTTSTVAPTGAVAINGAEFNTKEKQQGAFTNIQPVGNTLYGIPKAPIVPDILPQKDFTGATTPQVLSEGAEKAKGMVGFTDIQKTDLEKANQRLVAGTGSDTDKKNVEYAKSKGWQPTSTEVAPVVEPAKSTADTLFEKYSDIATVKANAKAEAMKSAGLDEKSQAIAAAQSVVNKYRTDLQNKGILDIKEQDIRRAQPILTSQIAANLNELSREQKLDTMILQNNYNNALVEQEIAQGNYDRAREIVKETADDAYATAKDQIEALKFKNEIEEKTAEKLDKELEYERDLAREGYVLIRSVDGLKGLTEDKIYRDPVSNKIYMKPAPEVATTMEIGGVTYGFDKLGNKIANYGVTEKGTGTGGGGGSGGSGDGEGEVSDFDYAVSIVDANPNATPEELKTELLRLNSIGEIKLTVSEINSIVAKNKKAEGETVADEENPEGETVADKTKKWWEFWK